VNIPWLALQCLMQRFATFFDLNVALAPVATSRSPFHPLRAESPRHFQLPEFGACFLVLIISRTQLKHFETSGGQDVS
jgi:hypothetical protein